MPIDWDVFKKTTKTYFKSFTAQNEQQAAQFIATQYTAAVLQGGDSVYGNVVITQLIMTDVLSSAITDAFTKANSDTIIESVVPQIFGALISKGLVDFWTGAQLVPLIPPPTSTVVVTNIVSIPGVPIPILRVSATENEDEFIDNLVDFFIQHLKTLQGVTTALVTTPTGPVPTPFLWQGYG